MGECNIEEIKRMEWQPIDTAPMDGSWILLRGGEVCTYWDFKTPKPPCVVAQYHQGEYDEVWQFAWYDGGVYGEYRNPTHWCYITNTN